jgi:transcriptional regulator with XRE-family HTH domain
MPRVSYQPDGLAIAKRRTALGLSQEALAARCGVHRVTIANIENGRYRVSTELLDCLAGELGVTREHALGLPEQIDTVEAERRRIARAMASISDGFEELTAVLNDRVREERDRITPTVKAAAS